MAVNLGHTEAALKKMRKLVGQGEWQKEAIGVTDTSMVTRMIKYGIIERTRQAFYKVCDGVKDPLSEYNAKRDERLSHRGSSSTLRGPYKKRVDDNAELALKLASKAKSLPRNDDFLSNSVIPWIVIRGKMHYLARVGALAVLGPLVKITEVE